VLIGPEMSMVVVDFVVIPFCDVYAMGVLLWEASESESLVNEE